MNSIRTFMRSYPMVSSAVIFPFVFMFMYSMLSLFIEIFLPVILSVWLTGLIYNMISQNPSDRSSVFWTTKYYK